jgi:hypothetical protein
MEAQQQPTAHGKRSSAARSKLKKEKQALLDAQFANLELSPEKQPKLLAELLYHIIDLGVEDSGNLELDNEKAQTSRSFLCSTSLVRSDWRDYSQRRLMELVSLRTNRAMSSFLFCQR